MGDQQVSWATKNFKFKFKIKRRNMFQIFEIWGKRFEYSNIIRPPKFSNPNPNIRDSRKKIRIQIESEYIRSSLSYYPSTKVTDVHNFIKGLQTANVSYLMVLYPEYKV